ncbi:uncharacterized protein LOC110881029 [Helianthus annuus]|uniref:uncharacterized protein LOC110881029 n=1 Tax=Helianthus annuus TaxID=4232 RepID=UPI000B9075DF|nr:uncharacterized protein LOC110881029 [Helianthus annuus]
MGDCNAPRFHNFPYVETIVHIPIFGNFVFYLVTRVESGSCFDSVWFRSWLSLAPIQFWFSVCFDSRSSVQIRIDLVQIRFSRVQSVRFDARVKPGQTWSTEVSMHSGDLGVPPSKSFTLVNTWIIGRLSNYVDSQDVEESS